MLPLCFISFIDSKQAVSIFPFMTHKGQSTEASSGIYVLNKVIYWLYALFLLGLIYFPS